MGTPRIISWGSRTVFATILCLGLLAMTARSAVDPDLWWHLRTGQWIVESGAVPHTDPFSFTRAGHPWISHEWLSEVIFYKIWQLGGATALIIFSSLVTTFGFMLLYLRCPGSRSTAAAVTVLGAWAAAPSWGSRPQMFTFALASLFLLLLERAEKKPRLLFSIPPLFVLWVNLHAGYALGPALLVAYALGVLAEAAIGATTWREARPVLIRITLLLVICMALVPLNPSGAELYRYPLDTLRSPGMRAFIGEWRSPNFHDALYLPLLGVWLLLLTCFAISRIRPRGRTLALLLLTALAALDAVRHIPIFVLVAVPVIAPSVPLRLLNGAAPVSANFRRVFAVSVLLLMAFFVTVRFVSLAHKQNGMEAKDFPQKAVDFLLAREAGKGVYRGDRDYPTRVFAYYDWGGYVIWKLFPNYRVFIDGRADLYGDSLLHEFSTAVDATSSWNKVLDDSFVDTALLPASSALTQALMLDAGWKIAYRDPMAVFLVRVPSERENPAISTYGTSARATKMKKNSP
jgi:hypothetical protein